MYVRGLQDIEPGLLEMKMMFPSLIPMSKGPGIVLTTPLQGGQLYRGSRL